MEEVINKIQEQRAKLGITQVDLAEGIGVSRQTIISVEKGNYTPSVCLALKLAKHFKVKVEEIFFIKKCSN